MENIFELIKDNVKNPMGGLYIHLIQPSKDMFEYGKEIKAGTSVIKPGKFQGKLTDRMKQYDTNKYWHYECGEAAFIDATTKSYLILDGTNLPENKKWLIPGLEEHLSFLIKQQFNIISKVGKGKSEYREIEFKSFEEYDAKIKYIYEEIQKEVKKSLK